MKTELVHTLTNTFEAHAQRADNGVEFWLARDIQYLLGYSQWRNFLAVINKAKTACEVSSHPVTDHFADVSKMVDLGSGSQREIDDIMLTRYACQTLESFATLLPTFVVRQRDSCGLNWLKRGRNLSQPMMWASKQPHMPVASIMMEFRLR